MLRRIEFVIFRNRCFAIDRASYSLGGFTLEEVGDGVEECEV